MEDTKTVKFKQQPEGLVIYTNNSGTASTDRIIQLKTQ